VDNWFSFSRLGIYYCYKISLEGCLKTTASPTDVLLAVKCDLGPDFVFSSFKLCGAQDYVNVAMKYAGIIHLNEEQASLCFMLSSPVLIT
jgi:endoribonuclease Dicer